MASTVLRPSLASLTLAFSCILVARPAAARHCASDIGELNKGGGRGPVLRSDQGKVAQPGAHTGSEAEMVPPSPVSAALTLLGVPPAAGTRNTSGPES